MSAHPIFAPILDAISGADHPTLQDMADAIAHSSIRFELSPSEIDRDAIMMLFGRYSQADLMRWLTPAIEQARAIRARSQRGR